MGEQQLTYNTLLITQPKSDFRADDRLTQGSEIVKLTKEKLNIETESLSNFDK